MNLINTKTLKYPIDIWQVREDNPNVSFSLEPSDDDLEPFGYANVHPTDRPTDFDQRTKRLEEKTPKEESGAWKQVWSVRNATPEEIEEWDKANSPVPDYRFFYDSLIVSEVYKDFMGQAMSASTNAPSLALTLLVSAIQDCLGGRPNTGALNSAISLLLSTVKLSDKSIEELKDIIKQSNLGGVVSLGPQ